MGVQTLVNYCTQASVYKVTGKYKSITVSELLPLNDGTSPLNYLLPSFMIMKYSIDLFSKCMKNILISLLIKFNIKQTKMIDDLTVTLP